jgi:hypothetical protein
MVEAMFLKRAAEARTDHLSDPYDLEWRFACWSWEAGYESWNDGLRAPVQALRGL